MTETILTQESLKESLHYCPETGVFTWLSSPQNRINVGDEAGCVTEKGYKSIMINGKAYSAHRLAFLYVDGALPPEQVDHINHIKSDNRWSNLRLASSSDNAKNKGKYKNNSSGMSGVYWFKQTNKWCVQVGVNGKKKTVGYFDDINDAISARKLAESEHGYHENHGTT